ncbi:hypothetical protein CDL15_Pgr004972 [Punica granatum]|uniref:Thioredoxin-like fold domain-containing protein MRL7, chloroplastic n=2 Tax=Punica granatum TaxID=22663 RepID=A0A218WWQ4_PUNGR|nr:hypothetical protein CDL15_Pgr004972 [Punica granatum]
MFLQAFTPKYIPAPLPLSQICLHHPKLTRHSSRLLPSRAAAACTKSSSEAAPNADEPLEGDDLAEPRTLRMTKPRKARRGRRSEAAAVEDFVRDSLDQTFASIRKQSPEVFENYKEDAILKNRKGRAEDDDDDCDGDENDDEREKEFVVEEESMSWPVDADVGWGIRASEYFEQHPIRNVVGEGGAEIDWEGEVEDSWVKEINCLEWESFAFHPSPLIVLVFERYNRASENWKALKELESAIKVYWKCKDRLPPRAIKIDINIERDLAYALKVKNCPQVLFLRGNKILYREKEFRTADELIQMIAHFYYNAKKPSWVKDTALNPAYKF